MGEWECSGGDNEKNLWAARPQIGQKCRPDKRDGEGEVESRRTRENEDNGRGGFDLS